ncbi:hypothetical protein FDUTEX481_01956 [Tolypothrix sp. PCC 7601]|nr:hypothetical protein FDUTEX481_01956 [Tolypothrix sp. PCC 7601]
MLKSSLKTGYNTPTISIDRDSRGIKRFITILDFCKSYINLSSTPYN